MLAAQSIMAILTPESTSTLLLSLTVNMSSSRQNQLHGLLLIIVHVLKESPWLARKEMFMMERLLDSLLEKRSLGTR